MVSPSERWKLYMFFFLSGVVSSRSHSYLADVSWLRLLPSEGLQGLQRWWNKPGWEGLSKKLKSSAFYMSDIQSGLFCSVFVCVCVLCEKLSINANSSVKGEWNDHYKTYKLSMKHTFQCFQTNQTFIFLDLYNFKVKLKGWEPQEIWALKRFQSSVSLLASWLVYSHW